jgi:hypothetical protein
MKQANMKKTIYILLLFVSFFSCKQPEGFHEAEDPMDAGREFLRSVLDGDFEKASLYVLDNAEDKELLERYKGYMKNQPQKERLNLKSSSIIINKIVNVNDSVTIINYSNSYSMKPTDLKVVLSDKKWRIDFSYTFSENMQSK